MIRMPDIPGSEPNYCSSANLERIGKILRYSGVCFASYISVSDKSRSGSYLAADKFECQLITTLVIDIVQCHARVIMIGIAVSPFPDSVYQTSSFTEIPAHTNQASAFIRYTSARRKIAISFSILVFCMPFSYTHLLIRAPSSW